MTENLTNYIQGLETSEFYGTVSLKFDRGRIVLINLQQAIKPEEIQGGSKPSSEYVRRNDQQR